MSPQDTFVLECSQNSFQVRSLTTFQVVKQELSANKVESGCWVDKDQFVTAAQSEVMLWSLKQENPVTILDT